MSRMLKVFCSGTEQNRVAEINRVVERYDGFVIAEIPEEGVSQLSRVYPVEDITDLYIIKVGERTIDTSLPRVNAKGKIRSHPAYKGARPLSAGRHHYLVQFIGPIKDEWLKAVRKIGAEPRASHGDFTYIIRADEDTLKQISALKFVRWVGHLPHRDRVAPSVFAMVGRKPEDTSSSLPRTRVVPRAYTVEFFGSEDLNRGVPAVKKLGFRISGKEEKGKVLIVETEADGKGRGKQLEALAAVHGVRSIRERSIKRTCNDIAATIMGTAITMGNPGLGLSGKGEYIGICDTGIDTGDPKVIHRDFAGRIAWIKSYPITPDFSREIDNPGGDDGPADLDTGHGTHVAGSVLGNGTESTGLPGLTSPIRGLAYKARLVFQAVEQEMKWKNPAHLKHYGRYPLAGIPLDLTTLFSDAYRRRARIHSNSWNGGDPGAYDSQCEQLDRFVWEHKDFCVIVAAGNDGIDKDGGGMINPMGVASPSTAKNCITVGACENRRSNFNNQTYGDWWPGDYPIAPFRDDPMSDNPDQVVAFSSRGPTQDGRLKPDVIAPGTFILSTRSTMIAPNNMGWAAFPPSRMYFHMGGTSMATPLTAGAVALLREYFRKNKKIRRPSAALLKATLIAGATRLPGYAPKGAVCDNHQGFGRVNLDTVLSPSKPASIEFLEVRPGLRTGEIYSLEVEVKSGDVPFRVTLAYSDYPGPSLVNNLNLIVTAPNRQRYIGNQTEGRELTLDVRNNVEVVHVRQPIVGKWKIEVVGSNVPHGPQDFALVYMAHIR